MMMSAAAPGEPLARMFFSTMYKYVLFLCNCRSDFEQLQNVEEGDGSIIRTSPRSSRSNLTGAGKLYDRIDALLDGSDDDRQEAFTILKNNEISVSTSITNSLYSYLFDIIFMLMFSIQVFQKLRCQIIRDNHSLLLISCKHFSLHVSWYI